MSPAPIRLAMNALTLPANLAGIGFYAINLASRLAASPRIDSITIFSNRQALEHFPPLPGKVALAPFGLRSVPAKALAAQLALPRRLDSFDLIHSVGNVACLPTGMPQVVTIHDLCQRRYPERFGPAKRAYLNLGLALTAFKRVGVVCDSECTLGDLARYHPSLASRAKVVHLACKYPVDRSASGPRQGLLFVGTLEPGKNLAMALRALALLRDRHGIRKTLAVVGAKGWKQSNLADLVRDLDLSGQVDFLGYLDDEGLRQRYRSAECLVFPSVYEGFGLPILEAQSQGCPAVVADNSSLREIGGDGCHYFPTQDMEGLLRHLIASHADPRGFAAIREAGFANCDRFSWDKTAAQTLAVYEATLAASRRIRSWTGRRGG